VVVARHLAVTLDVVPVLGDATRSAMLRVRAADERYMASVNQEGWSTYPSCSMPIE